MEFYEIPIIIAVIGIFSIVIIKMILNKTKKPIKPYEKDQIQQIQQVNATQIKEIQETYEESNLQLRKSNKSLVNQVNGLRSTISTLRNRNAETEEDETDELENYTIDWQKASEFGTKLGLDMKNFDINNTALVEFAKQKIIENRDLAIVSGILKSKTNGTNNSEQVPATETGNSQNLIDASVKEHPFNTV